MPLGNYTNAYAWELPAPGNEYIYGEFGGCPSNNTSPQICGFAEPLIVANAAFNLSVLWADIPGYTTYDDLFNSVSKDLYAAYTAVQCLHGIIEGAEDSTAVQFPGIMRTNDQYAHPVEVIPYNNLSKAEVYAFAGNISDFEMMWTELPDDLFGDAVSGVILIEPRDSTTSSSRNITTCSIATGWGTSSIYQDWYEGLIYLSSSNVPAPISSDVISAQGPRTPGIPFTQPIFANESDHVYPQRPVTLPAQWLQYLNPVTTLPDGSNNSVINAYMSLFTGRLSEYDLAQLVSFMVGSGMSIIGLDLAWQCKPFIPF